MSYCAQETTNACIYVKALEYFKAEFHLLKYLMSPPEDSYNTVPAAQFEEVDIKEEEYILISTSMTHNTVNYEGVEAIVEN